MGSQETIDATKRSLFVAKQKEKKKCGHCFDVVIVNAVVKQTKR